MNRNGTNDGEESKMKGILTKAGWLVVAAALMASIGACNTADKLQPEETESPGAEVPMTYTLTVTATKGDDDATRALSLNGKTLNATWARGDKVDVYIEQDVYEMGSIIPIRTAYKKVGTLTALGSGAEATLSGEVTLSGSGRPRLLLFYGSPSYDYRGQKGSLEDVSAHYDYASGAIARNKYTIENNVITPEKSVTFSNRQAIVRFILKDTEGHPLFTNRLTVSATQDYTFNMAYNVPTETADELYTRLGSFDVVPASASGDFFIAMPACSSAADTFPFRLDFTGIDGFYYFYEKNVNFERGRYYEVTVKMKRKVDLSQLTSDYTAIHGDVLTGTLPANLHLSIAAGAEVTLMDVTISDDAQSGITCLGSATITLVGTNSVTSTVSGYAGVQAGGADTTLSIGGDGSLTARGGEYAAGIGGGRDGTYGDIAITGGTITATGGQNGAGIGSGCSYSHVTSCGSITISGGYVTATGGWEAAGIGTGSCGACGNITIGGEARGSAMNGSPFYVDIGTGYSGTCGTVSVAAGTISGITEYVPCTFIFRYFERIAGATTQMPFKNGNIIMTINGNNAANYTGTLEDDKMTIVLSIRLPAREHMNMTFSCSLASLSRNDVTLQAGETYEFHLDFLYARD